MQETTDTLRGIVERLHGGDEAAFEELYRKLSGRVFSYLIPRVKDRSAALDLMQEIFLAIWAARTRFAYRNDASVYGFVFTIARRTLAGYYDHARRDAENAAIEQDDRYDMDVESLGDAHMIERAMHELSEDDRDVMTLRYWSGFSFGEIADLKGSKETAVRVRHHRALEKLKDILASYDA